jgi:aldehyde dehydrogenase (NAD+)
MSLPDSSLPFAALFQRQRIRSQAFRSQPLAARLGRLKKIEQWLTANQAAVVAAVQADFYRPATEIEISEVMPVLSEVRQAIGALRAWARPLRVDAPLHYLGTRTVIYYEPKGVCLIIAPWNYPFNLCLSPLISALAAGNTAIIKPSEFTPRTGELIKGMMRALFDEDEVAVVAGDASVSQQLLRLPFDHIFFTGSPAVGKMVMKAAAETLASVTLELGGKSPAIVDASAHLPSAARRIAFGKFFNSGQTCIAPDYVLVEQSCAAALIELLRTQIRERFGNGAAVSPEAPDYARLIHTLHFQRTDRLVQQAVQQGAQVIRDSEPDPAACFFPPTLLARVPEGAAVLEEEIFGPVLPVLAYETEDEALAFINSRPKPLALYAFTARAGFREKITRQTTAGALVFNDCLLQYTHPHIPFGGVNHSGIGKAHGRYGFLAFSNEKPVVRQLPRWANSHLFQPPYTPLRRRLVRLVMKWML